jgi:predicted RNA binding protein YcfA (HicA-like mRNA interferase family)
LSLRPISARKVIKALSKVGFRLVRRRGSHVVLKHEDGRVTLCLSTQVRRSAEAYF